MTTLPAWTVSVSVLCAPDDVCAYVRDPRNLPAWAPGFARSVRRADAGWRVETADGEVGLAFVPDNPFGVVDHQVSGADGLDVLNPMRVLTNGTGAEVLFTVFQAIGRSDEQFERDVAAVASDLQTLGRLLEGER